MNGVRVEPGATPGSLAVIGELSFDTVGALVARGAGTLPEAAELEIDLAGVTRVDSAGLALLVDWLRRTRGAGRGIRFLRAPEQLRAIAHVSGLDGILPLQQSE